MTTTELYIVRHGLAGEHGTYADDRQRPLTEEGQRKTALIAKRLFELEVRVDVILTSPLVRAAQTADHLRQAGISAQVQEVPYLAPGGAIADWLEWLSAWQRQGGQSLALVGHEPDLSEWAETLIWGKPLGRLSLKKGGVIGLRLPTQKSPLAASELFWLSPPRLLLG
jgi:phosphohistidine phosphatase